MGYREANHEGGEGLKTRSSPSKRLEEMKEPVRALECKIYVA